MGIDVHLTWDHMTDEDRQRQAICDMAESSRRSDELRAFELAGGVVTADMLWAVMAPTSLVTRGAAGYIREGYGISPFPSALLVREAFAADDGTATIPAAVMRKRLHSVTEPMNRDVGVFMKWFHQHVAGPVFPDAPYVQTQPATVWECVQARCRQGNAAGGNIDPAEMMANYAGFVELAERREREQGHPCTVVVSQ
jgi:hypothetical protein